jgi:hypothetical protein
LLFHSRAAVDSDYSTLWESCSTPSMSTPAWVALDLSTVPASQRSHVVLAYYNQQYFGVETYPGSPPITLMDTFTIDGHSAACGGPGWVNLQSVSGATVCSQSYFLDLMSCGQHGPMRCWVPVGFTVIDSGCSSHRASTGTTPARHEQLRGHRQRQKQPWHVLTSLLEWRWLRRRTML